MEDFKDSPSKIAGQLLRQEPEKEKHPMLVGVLVFPNSTALRYGRTHLHVTLLGNSSKLSFLEAISTNIGWYKSDVDHFDYLETPEIPGHVFFLNCVSKHNQESVKINPEKTVNFVLLFAENSDDSLPIRQAAKILQEFQDGQLYGVTYSRFYKSITLTSCEPSDLRQHASCSYYDWLSADEVDNQIFYRKVLARIVELLPALTPIPVSHNSDDDSSQEVPRSEELVDQESDEDCDKENNVYLRPSF
ncbi:MAG: hypothetical protein SFW07_04900 [Gammaproteobacteria bacterium]|nr:hypothetical protein [Gammaproteobacteria bacterium]